MMAWEPRNLSATCPPHGHFTSCSYFGYIYLNLLVQLYSDSGDSRVQRQIEKERTEECLNKYRIEENLYKYSRKMNTENDWRPDAEHARMGNPFMKNSRTNKMYHDISRIRTKKVAQEYTTDIMDHSDDIGDQNDESSEFRSARKCGGSAEYMEKSEEYDFIVVGAGAAGCVIASRLTEHEFTVLLLEAGPEQPDVTLVPAYSDVLFGSNIDWNFSTQPDGRACLAHAGQRCTWPAGRTMGGGSSINTMSYIRGNRLDYDTWAALGNKGWSFKEVLPYFMKSEKNLDLENRLRKCHGVGGTLTISRYPYIDTPSYMMTEAYAELGLPLLDYNCGHQLGTMQAQAFSQSGERVSANRAFIQPVRYKRKNLTVRVESLAVEILIDNGNAYGVKYVRKGKEYTATAKKEVIVSSGPMNSPKLLMLSGIGPKEHLNQAGIRVKQDLHVGYNLQDHVTFDGMFIVLPNGTATTEDYDQVLEDTVDLRDMKIKSGPLSGNGPSNSIGFIKTDPSLPAPDIQYHVALIQNWREYIKAPSTYRSVSILSNAYYNALVPRAQVLTPKSRGRVLLNLTDIYAHPVIYANYLEKVEDLETLIKGVRFQLGLEETNAFRKRGAYFYKESLKPCQSYVWGTDDYIACMARAYTASTYHQAGTCKMGPKWDRSAVVDSRLRVYGIKGLRVIDSSIMPILPRGNLNAPTIMVAERGVHFLLEDWGKKVDYDDLFLV